MGAQGGWLRSIQSQVLFVKRTFQLLFVSNRVSCRFESEVRFTLEMSGRKGEEVALGISQKLDPQEVNQGKRCGQQSATR